MPTCCNESARNYEGALRRLSLGRDGAEHFVEFGDFGRFAQDAIDLEGKVAVFFHHHAPAGEHNDGSLGRLGFESLRELTTVNVGHSEIGNDDIKRAVGTHGGTEDVQARAAAVSHFDGMAAVFENL